MVQGTSNIILRCSTQNKTSIRAGVLQIVCYWTCLEWRENAIWVFYPKLWKWLHFFVCLPVIYCFPPLGSDLNILPFTHLPYTMYDLNPFYLPPTQVMKIVYRKIEDFLCLSLLEICGLRPQPSYSVMILEPSYCWFMLCQLLNCIFVFIQGVNRTWSPGPSKTRRDVSFQVVWLLKTSLFCVSVSLDAFRSLIAVQSWPWILYEFHTYLNFLSVISVMQPGHTFNFSYGSWRTAFIFHVFYFLSFVNLCCYCPCVSVM